ncbi:MAG: anthranilate synthase component I family protein [Coriobacteriia bacterium]
MLFREGPVIAPATVAPEAWAAAFAPERGALVLAPGSSSGWLGGLTLVACDPEWSRFPAGDDTSPYSPSEALSGAGSALDEVLGSRDGEGLCAVLLTYEGAATVARFRRGLARTPGGWRAWGDWRGGTPPQPVEALPLPASAPLLLDAASDLDAGSFMRGVEAVREAVLAGDVYVLNLTRRVTGVPAASPGVLFASMLERTSASMAASWVMPDRALISASPERFLSLGRGLVTVEPVKGTRPRHSSPERDAAAMSELSACEKELAEHVMVVDLERNDLGRACSPGSIVVSPLAMLVSTPYCHQLASRVGGRLADGSGCAELLAATFPCGSVTGAPKRSAMLHISELESGPREEYTGSLLVAVPGRLDSSVLIRSLVVRGDEAVYGVGGGITIDSDPLLEWEETIVKSIPACGAAAAIDPAPLGR